MNYLLSIYVQPGAKQESLELLPDGSWKIRLRARPIEGQANKAVCLQIADYLGVSKSSVTLIRGEKSRKKQLQITGLSEGDVMMKLKAVEKRK